MKHIKKFEEVNESWRNALLGLVLLFSSCDSFVIEDKSGAEISPDEEYTTTGIVKDVTSIPLDDGETYYKIKVIDDSTGNLIDIKKYAMNPFPKDETSGIWLLSDLEEGSKVKVVYNDGDCKVYLVK